MADSDEKFAATVKVGIKGQIVIPQAGHSHRPSAYTLSRFHRPARTRMPYIAARTMKSRAVPIITP